MIEFTPEQMEKIRFCLENWDRIELLQEKKLFNFKNGRIIIHYRPNGQIHFFEYYQSDNEMSYPHRATVKVT